MTNRDRTIIRDLATQVAEIAARPEQEEKRRIWYAQTSLKPIRPPVFCTPEGAWEELLPEEVLTCEEATARGIERGLRMHLYAAEHFSDDSVCDGVYRVGYVATSTGWGMSSEYRHSTTARGAYTWEGAIKCRADIDRLQTPTTVVDRAATQQGLEFHQELLGDILRVELHAWWWWTLGLIDDWTHLRGIEQTFLDMIDEPELLHAGMQRLMEGKLAWLESLESQGLLSLNNGNDYCGSGSLGYARALPSEGYAGQARLIDLWGFCEAQALSLVGPAQHEEFVLQYQVPVMERFGLNYYGCCEPLHLKLDMLKRRVPRLRRVSVSAWADKRICAEQLGSDIIFGWKPNPAYLAGVEFDRDLVRRDIRETVDICREHGCCLEMTIKDTHTCNHQPWRFDEWTKIAMEEAER